MRVLIVGAGIGGLTTALSLHAAGVDVEVVDSVRELRPLGVGINLLPHATRELIELGLGDALAETGLPVESFAHFDRHGNRVWGEPRGLTLGYRWPQYSIHRGELQMLLLATARERLGADAVRTGTAFVRFIDGPDQVSATLRDQATGEEFVETADALVGADGLYSAVRAQLHPGEGLPLWNGVRLWRGVTEADAFLDGHTMAILGTRFLAKFVVYPISRPDERGRASLNWLAEVQSATGRLTKMPDWNRAGRLEDVLPHFADWNVGWLDVPGLISGAEEILEYPMVDRDPLPFWSRGRVTLLGDAAHPMYPVGSNGGSQAILDARALAYELTRVDSPADGLAVYEAVRRKTVNAIVLANRTTLGDTIMETVARRAPDGFDRVDEVLSEQELAALADGYLSISHTDGLNLPSPWTPVPRPGSALGVGVAVDDCDPHEEPHA